MEIRRDQNYPDYFCDVKGEPYQNIPKLLETLCPIADHG